MKPYGYKKPRKMIGDGCFLCTGQRKTTKTATRQANKSEVDEQLAEAVVESKQHDAYVPFPKNKIRDVR